MTKGAHIYIPKEFFEELEEMKHKFNMKNKDALRQIVKDSRIGREVRFTIDFNMRKKR